MASVMAGARRHRAALDQPLLSSRDGVDNTEIRGAQLTAAEHAIAGDWVDELGDVLDVLGLR